MLEIIRTALIKVDLPFETAKNTVTAWTEACNAVSRIAFENGKISNAVKLQQLGYETAKSFGLSAQVAVSCNRHVASKYATARTAKKTLKKPVFFGQCAVALQGGKRGRDFGFKPKGVSIWTLSGRIKGVAFHGEPKLAEHLTEWKMGDGRLFVRKGRFF